MEGPSAPHAHLERLEALHGAEEEKEALRDPIDASRPLRPGLPEGGRLFGSQAWLDRLYEGERVVREKKPGVFDHLRSRGAWFVSVDDPPLSVLDGMSQTATLPGGFAEDAVVAHYVEGGFGDTLVGCDDTAAVDHPAAQAFADELRFLLPGLPQVTFTNSGAEAVEKALALCRLHAGAKSAGEARTRVLAFEGSFHGRTLLALHASHNPAKRAPFEIAGHEVTFASFPVWNSAHLREPREPPGYLAMIGAGDVDGVLARWGSSVDAADTLLQSELRTLREVHRALSTGQHFAVLVEPMQSEGGDRYATSRFFRALRVLTRHHGVSLVFDEVQTGFGLSGTFAWHTRFGLVDVHGRADRPDAVTFAKRAQVGVVMSPWEDPEPTSVHTASLVRGLLHARLMARDDRAREVEERVRTRLGEIEARFPDLVGRPRATGYAFAFDLPTSEHLAAYLAQRFYRGAIVFGAGTRTVRYRLSTAYGERELDLLLDAVRRSLKWLEAHPGTAAPAWQDPPPAPRESVRRSSGLQVRIRTVRPDEAGAVLDQLIELEDRVYEPARRDPVSRLRLAFDDPDGVAVVCEVHEPGALESDEAAWRVVGCALGAPIEHLQHLGGPDRDPMQGRHNTLYSIALTVDPDYQGLGLGRRLKEAQLRAARDMCRPGGSPRYRYVAGRNRVGRAAAMTRLNFSYHACALYRVRGGYEDPAAEALYYRQPLRLPAPDPASPALRFRSRRSSRDVLDVGSGLSRPFAVAPPSLRAAHDRGLLFGPTVNKLTLCNYVTPAVVRAVEWVGALTPHQPHLYLTSSRDECFDKALRALKWHRPAGTVVLGLEGGYVGHTTAAARSLSDPAVHAQGPGYFRGWARLPHPAREGMACTAEALLEAVHAAGGPEHVIGLFVEPIQERTGRVVAAEAWPTFRRLRDELQVPLVLVETAGACYRSARGGALSVAADHEADAVLWWGGGQVGFVHVASRWFVREPLTLVSTWDGDELSLVRVHHQLRAARHLDVAERAEALDRALAPAYDAGLGVRGAGVYRVIDSGSAARAERMVDGLWDRGVRTRAFANGCVVVAPPLDMPDGGLARLRLALGEVCA
jgi:RHH-type transcriptional regulator, proline utilization regulon repressor / proline dehydrogenase / delta 1-pyrroline-5-carboxylate dehydrogenase